MQIKPNKKFWFFLVFVIVAILIGYKFYYHPNEPDLTIGIENLTIQGPSIVNNGDFEDPNILCWPRFRKGDYETEKGMSRSGCISYTFDDKNNSLIFGQIIPLDGVLEALLLEGWVKADGGANGKARIYVDCFNPKIKKYSGWLGRATHEPIIGNTEWEKIEFAIDIPKETIEVELTGYAYGTSGRVFFDNIELYPAKKN